MPNIFIKDGRSFSPIDRDSIDLHDSLPVGTYTVKSTPKGFMIEQIENMALPAKRYGDVPKKSLRILQTFADRSGSTGVLLSGQKGSGKTMLAKQISRDAHEKGIITIVINQPLRGEDFNAFIQNINQPAVVLFDEFEKVYDVDEQQEMLTLFDGTYASKKLFILTCNDKYRVGQYMHNRPGRLFYSLEFGGLDKAFIEEYCNDVLKNKAHMTGVLVVSAHFSEFSFDMLKALVEEMNRYDETAGQAMEMLNIKPQSEDQSAFDVSVLINGESAKDMGYMIQPEIFRHNPLTVEDEYVHLRDGRKSKRSRPTLGIRSFGDVCEEVETDDADELESMSIEVDASKLEVIRAAEGIFVIGTNRPDVKVAFTRRIELPKIFKYDAF